MRSAIAALNLIAVAALLAFAPNASAARILYIRGAGYGHGVGMSQYGSYGYALHGKSYQFILAHYYQGTSLGTVDPAQIVRVLLQTGTPSFAGATKAGSKKLNPSITYTVKALPDGSLALINPKGKRIGKFAAPLTVSGPGPLTVAGLGAYRGSLQFRPDGGAVDTINALALDDYLRGVVAAEMPSTWPAQALDVQAIAARTYAITSDVDGSAYDLYSDTRSQEYKGMAAETPATDAAVQATSGQIVAYDGAPAITYFSSSSGGYTEDVQNAFPGASPEPWLQGVPDPYDGADGHNPYHRWSRRMTVAAAEAKLGSWLRGSLVGIDVLQHGASPRVLRAAVAGSKGRSTVTGIELQQRFGLPSTWARFTTISSYASSNLSATPAVTRAARTRRPSSVASEVARVAAALVDRVFLNPLRIVYGQISPGAQGSSLLLQREVRGRWQTVLRTTLGNRGGYALTLPSSGTYRVVSGGLDGPPVTAR